MNTRLLFCLLWLTPLLCQGASFTSYFYNVEAITNVTARSAVNGLTARFTNSLSAAGFDTLGTTNATLIGNLRANGATLTNGITAGASTFTGPVSFLSSGSSSVPQITATGDENTGFNFAGSDEIWVLGGGQYRSKFTTAGYTLRSDSSLSWAASTSTASASDTFLVRDGAANTLAMRNGTAAQTFNIYNTYTDASNYERMAFNWNANNFDIVHQKAGTGANRTIRIIAGSNLEFWSANTLNWRITSGNLICPTDNTYDIGAAGATRPRTGYFGTSVNVGSSGTVLGSSLVLANNARLSGAVADGVLTLFNNGSTDFGRLQFGGTTASFPALKRSTTEIQVRLADDSADGGLKSGSLSNTGIRVMTPSTLQTLAAGNALLANATKVRVVGSGGAVTLTSTPTIADGTDGQYVMIQGTDDTNTLTVQDQSGLASSNLELGAATRVLGAGDVLCLTFDTTASVWYEVSFANN